MSDEPVKAVIDALQAMADRQAIFESDASDPVAYATQAEGPMTRTLARIVGVPEDNVAVRSMDFRGTAGELCVSADVLMPPEPEIITIAITKYKPEEPT
jgi:hypothetical protein